MTCSSGIIQRVCMPLLHSYLWVVWVRVENADTWQTSMDNAALTCRNRDSTWSEAHTCE